MKKLIMLLIIGVMMTGCGSTKDGKSAVTNQKDKIAVKDKEAEEKKAEDSKSDQNNESTSSTEKEQRASDTVDDKKKDSTTNTKEDKKETPSSGQTNGNSQTSSKSSSTSGDQSGNTSKPSTPSEPAPTPTPEPSPAPEPTPEAPSNRQAKADQVFAQINVYRQQNGKGPLTYSAVMRSRCESHALAIASRQALWHSGDGAECITNYDDPFSAWVNSPAHNKLLLSNNTEGAVGIYYYNGYYYSVFQTRW